MLRLSTGFTESLIVFLVLSGCGDRPEPVNTPPAPVVPRGSDAGVDVLDEYDLQGRAVQPDRYTRLYDPATVITVEGAVIEKEVVELERGAPMVVIELTSGGDFLVVALAPEEFLDEHISVRLTDRVEVAGSSVTVGGRRLVVARTIRKGGNTVQVREENGRPLWQTDG